MAPMTFHHLEPGGKDGPGGAVRDSNMLGGGVTMDTYSVGGADEPWRLAVPDVRMAPNQFWPMHWHGCWIAVIVLDGRAMLGDWWMPFVYNVTIDGLRATVSAWIFLGALVALARRSRAA